MKNLWEEVASRMNSLRGPTRTASKWKETLAIWKNQLRTRARNIKCDQRSTGGGPATAKKMSDLEEQALATFGAAAVDGINADGYLGIPSTSNQQNVFPCSENIVDLPSHATQLQSEDNSLIYSLGIISSIVDSPVTITQQSSPNTQPPSPNIQLPSPDTQPPSPDTQPPSPLVETPLSSVPPSPTSGFETENAMPAMFRQRRKELARKIEEGLKTRKQEEQAREERERQRDERDRLQDERERQRDNRQLQRESLQDQRENQRDLVQQQLLQVLQGLLEKIK